MYVSINTYGFIPTEETFETMAEIDMQYGNQNLQCPITVAVVPLPSEGRLNKLFQLATHLSARSVHVDYISTAAHNSKARQLINSRNIWPYFDFHDLLSGYSCLSDQHPSLLPMPVTGLISTLATIFRRVVVIYDPKMAYAVQDVVSQLPNVEAYRFWGGSAYALLASHMARQARLPSQLQTIATSVYQQWFPSDNIHFFGCRRIVVPCKDIDSGVVFDSSTSIEGQIIHRLLRLSTLPVNIGCKTSWPIGPLSPVSPGLSVPRHRCLVWLDTQLASSVIYVPFETTSGLIAEQIEELGNGLIDSNQKFVWVLKDPEQVGEDIEVWDTFDELVRENGMVVRDLALHWQILVHPSIGGLLTHCSWNSCMESIFMGVPIVAWPMHFDQPLNSHLVTNVLKIGVLVKEWTENDEFVTSSIIEEALNKLMNSREGLVIKKKAAELGVTVRQCKQIDSFIGHIKR